MIVNLKRQHNRTKYNSIRQLYLKQKEMVALISKLINGHPNRTSPLFKTIIVLCALFLHPLPTGTNINYDSSYCTMINRLHFMEQCIVCM